jgi:hypothetical protein
MDNGLLLVIEDPILGLTTWNQLFGRIDPIRYAFPIKATHIGVPVSSENARMYLED